MKIKNLRDLFVIELCYAYDVEQKLVKRGLPGMIEAATSRELRSGLEQHLQETRGQVARLERVFSSLGVDAKAEDSDVIDELISGTKDLAGDIDPSHLRDAALIVCGNKVEHFEMAIYGSLVAFARQLGLKDAATLLQQTLDEEKASDAKLTRLGEHSINPLAAGVRRAA